MNRAGAIGLTAWMGVLWIVVLASQAPAGAQSAASQWNGVYTAAQAKRGEALYALNCAPCHNWNLTGNEIGPALTGTAFAARWNGRSLAELFEYIQVLMPQNSPGGLSPQQNADILAFMFQASRAPDGKTELPARTDNLKPLIYLAK